MTFSSSVVFIVVILWLVGPCGSAINHGVGWATIVEHEGTRQHGLELHIARDVQLLVWRTGCILKDEGCGLELEMRLLIILEEFSQDFNRLACMTHQLTDGLIAESFTDLRLDDGCDPLGTLAKPSRGGVSGSSPLQFFKGPLRHWLGMTILDLKQ
jgi:hypothetical protein